MDLDTIADDREPGNPDPERRAVAVEALPSELLAKIAAHLPPPNEYREGIPQRRPGSRTVRKFRGPPSRIIFSHVCRRWRQAIYEHRTLWSDIPTTNRGLTQHALEHSNGVPISIITECHPNDSVYLNRAAQQLAFSALSRARVISFTLHADSIIDGSSLIQDFTALFSSFTGIQAPLLEEFSIVSHGSRFYPELPLLGDIVIQDDFLPPEMPFLRTLRLWNCALNPISHLLQAHLVELCLDNCQRWSRIDDVLDALERLPTLQKLSLQKDCRTILPPSFEESPRRVSLPVLEELTLYDDARAVVPLYNCLSFPFNTLVAFGVQETTSIHRTQVAAILAEYTSRRLPVLSLDISGPKPEARSTFSIEISAYPHLIGSSASDQEDTPASLLYRPLKLRLGAEWLLSGNGIPVEPTLPLSAIYHLPSLRTVRSVAINGKTGLTSSRCLRQIRAVLYDLPNLERIQVTGASVTALISVLYYDTTLHSHLRVIVLDDGGNSRRPGADNGTVLYRMRGEPRHASRLFDALVHWVKVRLRAAEMPVRVELRECAITKEEVNELGTVLGDDLVWDGFECGMVSR